MAEGKQPATASTSQRPASTKSNSSDRTSNTTNSNDSAKSSGSVKSWAKNLFWGPPNDTDPRLQREKLEMWRIMAMGYENVGQYVDVGEWIGR